MAYTQAEYEEARYEAWIMSGGRERAQHRHIELAEVHIDTVLCAAGWCVLDKQVINDHWHDIRIMEIVVRRSRDLRLLRWCPANKGWMVSSDTGAWLIFDPVRG